VGSALSVAAALLVAFTLAPAARAADVNTEQLLAFDKIIVTKEALTTLSERLAS
jgi:ribosomal protein L4